MTEEQLKMKTEKDANTELVKTALVKVIQQNQATKQSDVL